MKNFPSFQNQLLEVKSHYAAGDMDLAHRRLLDCVIETANMQLFQQALQYCDWLDSNISVAGAETVISKASQLLDAMQNIPIKNNWKETNTLLSASLVSKHYRKGNFSLNNISFSLEKGEITGLVGENGNGKTTLMRLIACDLSADGGNVDYFFNTQSDSVYDLRSNLLYVPQRIPRWWGSLMENLQFTLTQSNIKGNDNLLWAELMIARLGLRPYKELSWSRLSSGYRTKFELAKNLLRNPQILLLDEPLANLDINAQQTILQDLKYLCRSISRPFGMMISSQHIYEVEKVSNHIIFLKNGEAKLQQQTVENENTLTAENLILEIETTADRTAIARAFGSLPIEKIQYNGNVFIIYFEAEVKMQQIFTAISQSDMEINYLRDISRSTRRFFAQN